MTSYARHMEFRDACFSVMQFNVLADTLSGKDPHKGHFTCDPKYLEWDDVPGQPGRSTRLEAEIFRLDADLISLQEVDHFDDWLAPRLSEYTCHFFPKSGTTNKDGCVLAYKNSEFTLLGQPQKLGYNGGNDTQVAAAVHIRHRSGKEVLFSTTHLKATKTGEGEETRARQAQEWLNWIRDLVLELRDRTVAVVLCGDLNASPRDSPEYQARTYEIVLSHPLGLQSAYGGSGKDSEPEYTTIKQRANGPLMCHTIDYIFYETFSLRPVQLLSIPKKEELEECLLPGARYPSDHFALKAVLEFV